VREITLQTPRSVRRCLRCWSRDFSPAAHDKGHGEAGCPPAVRGGPWWKQISTCSLWRGPRAGADVCLKKAVILWRARAGAGSWQDLWTRGERSPRRSRFAGRACDPMGEPRWSSLCLKDCTTWEGSMLGQFMKSCSLWEGLTLEKFVESCLP